MPSAAETQYFRLSERRTETRRDFFGKVFRSATRENFDFVKGLGRAIVLFALSRFLVVEPDADFVFLHTHTWAYKAVGMYQKMGFRITKKALPTSRTDFSCIDVLKDVLPDSITAHLLEED